MNPILKFFTAILFFNIGLSSCGEKEPGPSPFKRVPTEFNEGPLPDSGVWILTVVADPSRYHTSRYGPYRLTFEDTTIYSEDTIKHIKDTAQWTKKAGSFPYEISFKGHDSNMVWFNRQWRTVYRSDTGMQLLDKNMSSASIWRIDR